jgi:hypothetical protein
MFILAPAVTQIKFVQHRMTEKLVIWERWWRVGMI